MRIKNVCVGIIACLIFCVLFAGYYPSAYTVRAESKIKPKAPGVSCKKETLHKKTISVSPKKIDNIKYNKITKFVYTININGKTSELTRKNGNVNLTYNKGKTKKKVKLKTKYYYKQGGIEKSTDWSPYSSTVTVPEKLVLNTPTNLSIEEIERTDKTITYIMSVDKVENANRYEFTVYDRIKKGSLKKSSSGLMSKSPGPITGDVTDIDFQEIPSEQPSITFECKRYNEDHIIYFDVSAYRREGGDEICSDTSKESKAVTVEKK